MDLVVVDGEVWRRLSQHESVSHPSQVVPVERAVRAGGNVERGTHLVTVVLVFHGVNLESQEKEVAKLLQSVVCPNRKTKRRAASVFN